MRASTSGSAGSRWKKDWPKSPRTMLPDEAGELHGQRVVEAHGLAQHRPVGLRRLRHHERDRVAAHLEDRERDERHAHEHHHEADDPAHEHGEHVDRLTGARARRLRAYLAAGLAS